MGLDFSKLGSEKSVDTIDDPQKIFQAFPNKDKRYSCLRDVQGEVLTGWHKRRTKSDLLIKMNTGGGKTVVGLLILKSCLNEGAGPAVYVAPDKYLVKQVLSEAERLGVKTTTNPRSSIYQSGKAILVINIYKLVNGKSVLGVGKEGQKIGIGSIIIDDTHACVATTEDQFTLSIPSENEVFQSLFALFKEDIREQSKVAVAEIEQEDPRALVSVPYWAWSDKQEKVIEALLQFSSDQDFQFIWPRIKNSLHLCQAVFGSSSLEISPPCLPINAIPSFAEAKRRIYLTATLSDDSVLISDFDANPNSVETPITPKTASDLGDRMILVPQELNPDITDDDIKQFITDLSKKQSVVVIVPSTYRAEFWEDVASETLFARNLTEGVARLRNGYIGLVVLVNKYDGVDLPDDACRVLVIDGVPDVRGLGDKVKQAVLSGSDTYRGWHIQRIEQGMGRGVRSNDDYCVNQVCPSLQLTYVITFGHGKRKISCPWG